MPRRVVLISATSLVLVVRAVDVSCVAVGVGGAEGRPIDERGSSGSRWGGVPWWGPFVWMPDQAVQPCELHGGCLDQVGGSPRGVTGWPGRRQKAEAVGTRLF